MGRSSQYKCFICGKEMTQKEAIDSCFMTNLSTECCKGCLSILNLKRISAEHWKCFEDEEMNNPIEERNWHEDKITEHIHGKVHSMILGKYKTEYEIHNRTKRVDDIIKDIDNARRNIHINIGPYMELLESMYNKDHEFWEDGGNMKYYLKNSIVSCITIRIKEYFDDSKNNRSKYSLYKYLHILKNDKKLLFEKQEVYSIKTFEKTGDVLRTKYSSYPIDTFLEAIQHFLNEYSYVINTLIDYRNNVFAHTGKLKKEDEEKELFTLINIRKIYKALLIIFDSMSYAVAPDKYANLSYSYNIWYGHLNEISKRYKKQLDDSNETE